MRGSVKNRPIKGAAQPSTAPVYEVGDKYQRKERRSAPIPPNFEPQPKQDTKSKATFAYLFPGEASGMMPQTLAMQCFRQKESANEHHSLADLLVETTELEAVISLSIRIAPPSASSLTNFFPCSFPFTIALPHNFTMNSMSPKRVAEVATLALRLQTLEIISNKVEKFLFSSHSL